MNRKYFHIYHTSDMHDHHKALDKLAETGTGDFLVDCGDAIRGSSTLFYAREPILNAMSRLGYHAMAMGNREFNYLAAVIESRQRQAGFPILSANVEEKRNKCLIQKYAVLEKDGFSVAFIGITPIQYTETSWWAKIFSFLFYPYVSSIRQVLQIEEVKKARMKILLSHAGFEEDRKIAAQISGIDLILGGHSHILGPNPVTVNHIPIYHIGSNGEFIGRIRVAADDPSQISFDLISC